MTAKRTALTLCGLLLAASPAFAEPSAAQRAAVAALWQVAFDDWSPLLTCGATMPESDEVIRRSWLKSVDQALAAMQDAGFPQSEIDSLRAKANPDSLRLPPDTTFAKLVAYCTTHSDWTRKAARLDIFPLGSEVTKTLTKATP